MLIDVTFAVLFVLACVKGYSKGFIVALFSIVGFIVGLAAALKLSAVVATKLSTAVNISSRWLPFLSFLLVFIVVLILINLGAKLIQKSVELVMLGWLNRLAGILLYLLLYSILLSVLLFYTTRLHIVSAETVSTSMLYEFIQPLGPKLINSMGAIIPLFKDIFTDLQDFFEKIPPKI